MFSSNKKPDEALEKRKKKYRELLSKKINVFENEKLNFLIQQHAKKYKAEPLFDYVYEYIIKFGWKNLLSVLDHPAAYSTEDFSQFLKSCNQLHPDLISSVGTDRLVESINQYYVEANEYKIPKDKILSQISYAPQAMRALEELKTFDIGSLNHWAKSYRQFENPSTIQTVILLRDDKNLSAICQNAKYANSLVAGLKRLAQETPELYQNNQQVLLEHPDEAITIASWFKFFQTTSNYEQIKDLSSKGKYDLISSCMRLQKNNLYDSATLDCMIRYPDQMTQIAEYIMFLYNNNSLERFKEIKANLNTIVTLKNNNVSQLLIDSFIDLMIAHPTNKKALVASINILMRERSFLETGFPFLVRYGNLINLDQLIAGYINPESVYSDSILEAIGRQFHREIFDGESSNPLVNRKLGAFFLKLTNGQNAALTEEEYLLLCSDISFNAFSVKPRDHEKVISGSYEDMPSVPPAELKEFNTTLRDHINKRIGSTDRNESFYKYFSLIGTAINKENKTAKNERRVGLIGEVSASSWEELTAFDREVMTELTTRHTKVAESTKSLAGAPTFFKDEKKETVCLNTFKDKDYKIDADDDKFISEILNSPFDSLKHDDLKKLLAIIKDEDKGPGLIFFGGPGKAEENQLKCIALLKKYILFTKTRKEPMYTDKDTQRHHPYKRTR